MGRDCRSPEIRKRSVGLASGELDWMLIETALWSDSGDDMETCATLLASCAGSSHIGGALAVPGDNGSQSFCKYGRQRFLPGMSWKVACATSSVIEFAVLYVDESSTLSVEELGQLVQSLKSACGLDTHVWVVCPDLATRQALCGADAYVIGATATTLRTAGMLAQLLCHAVQSPMTIACVDANDIHEGPLGTAEAPCVLAEAIWRWRPARLECLEPPDGVAIASAQKIVLDPGPVHARIADWVELGHCVRTLNQVEGFGLLAGGAYGHFRAACDSTRVALVRLLCVPSPALLSQPSLQAQGTP